MVRRGQGVLRLTNNLTKGQKMNANSVTKFHSFNVDIARECGVLPAILYQNIAYWVEKNAANSTNAHGGHYWTYCSLNAFCEIFSYMSKMQIRTALNKLIESGLIIVGDFNRNKYDRTKWYTTTDESSKAPEDADDFRELTNANDENNTCKCCIEHCANDNTTTCYQQHTDVLELTHGCVTDNRPIPNINTNINTDINTDKGVNARSRVNAEANASCETSQETILENSELEEKTKKPAKDKRFKPPTAEEVRAYCEERQNSVDADRFVDFYASKGWMVGSNRMKDWRAAVRTWERKDSDFMNSARRGITENGTVTSFGKSTNSTNNRRKTLVELYDEREAARRAEAEANGKIIDGSFADARPVQTVGGFLGDGQ